MDEAQFHESFKEIMDILQKRLSIKNAIVRTLDKGELKTIAYFGYGEKEANIKIMVGEGITGKCAEKEEVVLVNDLENYDGNYISGIEGAESEICLPIKSRGMTIATLNIESPDKNNFTPDKIDLLKRMSGFLSLSISNSENKTGTILARTLARMESK